MQLSNYSLDCPIVFKQRAWLFTVLSVSMVEGGAKVWKTSDQNKNQFEKSALQIE